MPMLKEEVSCLVCQTKFQKTRSTHKFCGQSCKRSYPYISKKLTTEKQYLYISGNWEKYFGRLLYKRRKDDGLTREVLMEVLRRQDYKCALSGKTLTCILSVGDGPCRTNASIDRIVAGGSYSKDNIQLVCKAINSFRNDMPVNEFVEWCRAVVETKGAFHHAHEAA